MKKNVKLYLEATDIPESCAECFLGKRYGFVGDVECKVLNKYFTGNVRPPHKERPDECPLVALPEKRGAWEVVFHFAPYQKCNACGFEMPMTAGEGVSEIKLHRYCPDCGARMDGGDRVERSAEKHGDGDA